VILTDSPSMIWPILDRPDKVLISTYILGSCRDIKALIGTFTGKRPIYWLGLLQPALPRDSKACVPKSLSDGRRINYIKPKNWHPSTEDWLHRVEVKAGL
jgi:hypothetical protein